MPISVGAGLAIAGGVSAAAGVAGSMISSGAASSAAKKAADAQAAMYEQTRTDLSPYNQMGQNALEAAYGVAQRGPTGGGPDFINMAYQNLPLRMTQAELEQTPGYQFTRDQGLKSIQSANAARGLGVSGAALKGAAEYSTGLANKTYQDQFNLAQKRFEDYVNLNVGQQGNLKNEFDRYNALATLGENAAAQTGAVGAKTALAEGSFLNAAGQAQGAGYMNAANALTGSLNNTLGAYYANQYGPNATTNPTTGGYGTSAPATYGTSASGNPVMTGFAPSVTQAQIRGGYTG